MRGHRVQRGTTLIEAMVAMLVLLIGALGVIAAHRQGLRLTSEARRITRASAIAQDVIDQIAQWPYNDPRLTNNAANDANLQDPNYDFEKKASAVNLDSLAERGEIATGDVNGGFGAYGGIPIATLRAYSPPFERFILVAEVDDTDNGGAGDGFTDAKRIAVVVRWGEPASGYRRIISYTAKANPNPSVTP